MTKKRWYEDDLNKLRDLAKYYCYDEIALEMNRTPSSIRQKCSEQKIPVMRKTYKNSIWNKEAVNKLLDMRCYMSRKELAKHFNVSPQNITGAIIRFGNSTITQAEIRKNLTEIHKADVICRKWV